MRKTPPEKSEILHEVENCADCRNDRALQESFSMLHGSAMTLEQNIAHRIVEEAYSRVSMDNIAVTALDLSLLQVCHALSFICTTLSVKNQVQ